MGGVLFIDEAYYLYRDSDSKDYGQEAIDILLQVMENDRDKLVVILAGYKDRMDDVLRVQPRHELPDRPPPRLRRLRDRGADGHRPGHAGATPVLPLQRRRRTAFREYLTLRMEQPRFANARSVRNELERARLRHAQRLASDPEPHRTMDDLMRIEPADILASPVFALAAAESAIRR